MVNWDFPFTKHYFKIHVLVGYGKTVISRYLHNMSCGVTFILRFYLHNFWKRFKIIFDHSLQSNHSFCQKERQLCETDWDHACIRPKKCCCFLSLRSASGRISQFKKCYHSYSQIYKMTANPYKNYIWSKAWRAWE